MSFCISSATQTLTYPNPRLLRHSTWLNVHLGKVHLETCWPAVYLVGRPTCPQGLLVAHVLAGPALLHSPIVADQSQTSFNYRFTPTPPSPSVSMFLASLNWIFPVWRVPWCWAVTGSPWIPHRWVTAAFGGPSITTHLPPPPPPGSSVDEF